MMLTELLLVLFGVLGSGFFSGIETGMISLNRVRLRHEVERKQPRALILHQFLENLDHLLGTTLLGTTLTDVVAAVFAASLCAQLIGAGYVAEIMAATIVTVLVLVFGEIVPKTIFRHYPHRLCTTLAYVLSGAAWLFAPVVAMLGVLMRFITRLSGATEQGGSAYVTREELKHLAREGEAGGAISADEREMIHGVFDFPHKTVFEVMVPLARAVTVARDTPVRELFDISHRTGFARFPVRDADKIVGLVNVYEILFQDAARDDKLAEHLMQKPQFVGATDRIDRILPRLRANRTPLSVVVNPEGGHVGIVTIEDIVEEIVGEVEG